MPKKREVWVINQPFSSSRKVNPVSGAVVTGGGSNTDHGTLSGLSDDDHTQYHNNTRGDARYYTQASVDALLHDRQHNITNVADHTVTGSQWQIVGLTTTDTLGLLTPSSDVSAPAQAILMSTPSGGLTLASLDAASLDITGPVQFDSTLTVDGAATLQSTLDVTGITTLDSDLSVGGNSTFIGDLASENWTSGTSGWKFITSSGTLDLQTVQGKNAEFETFIAEALRAQAGGVIITPSFAELTRDFVVPQPAQSATLYTSDLTGLDGWPSLTPGADIQITTYEGLFTGAPYYVGSAFASDVGDSGGTSTFVDEDFESPVAVNDTVVSGWNDTDANNSMTTNSSLFVVVSDSGQRYKTTSGSSNFHTHFNGSGYATLTNYTYTGQLKFDNASVGGGITLFSSYPSTDQYYRIRRYSSNKTFHVSNHGSYSTAAEMTGTTSSSFDPADATNVGNWINFKAEIANTGGTTTLKARFWKVGDAEPGTWQIDCSDIDTFNRGIEGTVGIWAHNAGSGLSVDNLLVQGTGTTINTSVVCSVPSAVRDGDLLIGNLMCTGTIPSTPTGWTSAATATVGGYGARTFTRTWSTGDAMTLTVNGSSADEILVSVAAFRGGTGAYNVALSTSTTTDVDASSVTTSQHALHVVAHMQLGATGATATPDTATYTSLTSQSGTNYQINWRNATMSAGPNTGSVDFTASASSNWIVLSLSATPSASNTSFSWGSAWGTIATITPPGDLQDGEIAYQFTTHTGSWGAGKTARAGSLALDYGSSGDGYIKMTTLDDAGSPYMDIATRGTWSSDTQSVQPTVHTRIGNLNGLGNDFESDEWGTYIAGEVSYAGYGDVPTQIVMSTHQSYFKNVALEWYDNQDELAMYINPSSGIMFSEGVAGQRTIDWEGDNNSYARLRFNDSGWFDQYSYSETALFPAKLDLVAKYSTTKEAYIYLQASSSSDSVFINGETISVYGNATIGVGGSSSHQVYGDTLFHHEIQADTLHAYDSNGLNPGWIFFTEKDASTRDGLGFDDGNNRYFFFADSTGVPLGSTTTSIRDSRIAGGVIEIYPQATNPAFSTVFATLYINDTDGHLYVKFPNGTNVELAAN